MPEPRPVFRGAASSGFAAWSSGLLASPAPEIICVEAHAEQVRGYEAELSGTHPDEADDDAVDAPHDQPLPQLFPYQNRRDHGQDARNVIQTGHKPTLSGRGKDDCADRI